MAEYIKDGFYPVLQALVTQNLPERAMRFAEADVRSALAKEYLELDDFLALLSPAALPFLEDIAKKANAETLRHFGKSIQIFTPLYLANHCTNRCLYCGFSAKRSIARQKLSLEEVEAEAKAIAATGLRKVLALTGDAPKLTGADYLASCIKVLSRYFSSVGIEVPSMTVEEYAMQVCAGADSMTMFQETYHEERYARLHPAGPKRDFHFRLDAPERAIMGGIRAVNLGPLLGLDDWRFDLTCVAEHARFLLQKYPQTELSISLPRIRPHTEGGEDTPFKPLGIDDVTFVQALVALRCYLPQIGITMSSREPAPMRDRLLPLGVTRVSAGVCTAVGGHVKQEPEGSKPQFDISDSRSVDEMVTALHRLGYEAVFTDWLLLGTGSAPLTDSVISTLGHMEQRAI